MAATQGHGNPDWTRDEVILALNLYFDCDGSIPGDTDPRVIALSELLQAYPYHSAASRNERFRNPAGVSFKLQNLRQVATNHGLANTSRTDREVWADLGNDPAQVKRIAELIRQGIGLVRDEDDSFDEDVVFVEGKILTNQHLKRERNPKLRKELLKERRASGPLICDLCGSSPNCLEESLGEAIFEGHHVIPLAAGEERKTRVKDMALLCANCHRIVHRAIASQKKWLTINEAAVLMLGTPAVRSGIKSSS